MNRRWNGAVVWRWGKAASYLGSPGSRHGRALHRGVGGKKRSGDRGVVWIREDSAVEEDVS